jgi:hypothetical protein
VVHNTMIRNRLGVAAMQYFVVGILVGDDCAAGGRTDGCAMVSAS